VRTPTLRRAWVTTLLDPTVAPTLELVWAYHERWEIEITIDEIATHQRLSARTLHSLHPVGVIQELYALLLVHYSVRVLMHEASLQADVDPEQVLQNALPEFQMITAAHLPRLSHRLLQDIATHRSPERRPRVNPRVVKRKMSNFPLKRPEHVHPPRLLQPFCAGIAII